MKKSIILISLCLIFPITTFSEVTPKEQMEKLETYFFAAARMNERDVIETFAKAGFPINEKNPASYTALMIAAYHGNKEVVNTLLDLGADPCIEDKRGNTALLGAIFKGEFQIAKRLIQADCNPNHQNNAGQTALMYTALFDQKEIKQLLLSKGADGTLTDHSGNSVRNLLGGQFKHP